LLRNAGRKDQLIRLLINKKAELSDDNVEMMLYYAEDKQEVGDRIINKNAELLTDFKIESLIRYGVKLPLWIKNNYPSVPANQLHLTRPGRAATPEEELEFDDDLFYGNNADNVTFYENKKNKTWFS